LGHHGVVSVRRQGNGGRVGVSVAVADGPPPELIFRRALHPLAMLRELWSRRELIVVLSERDLRARYKQTKVGFAWALLTPFLLMVVFTVFFKRVADVRTGSVPYPLFSYVGLLAWTFFSGALSKGAVSITQNLTLLNKVYCPREVFPLASVAVAGVDTGIAVSILGILFVIYQFVPTATIVWVPLLIAVQLAFTVGITVGMSAMVVYFRDLRQVLPMILQFGLFATPVGYGLEEMPRRWWPVYSALNPLVPVIDGYRRTILLGQPPKLDLLLIGGTSSALFLVVGYLMFKKVEGGFADVA
jgi:ABC-2 type transport system permease protein/lipopolysaccharide transport system permease protein